MFYNFVKDCLQQYPTVLIINTLNAIMLFNPFHHEFIKWTFPSLNSDVTVAKRNSVKNQNRLINSLYPDETAHERLIRVYTVLSGLCFCL